MKRKRRTSRRQVMLFPPVTQREQIPTETTREIVRALADLLLEALNVKMRVEGGRDDEHEDHA